MKHRTVKALTQLESIDPTRNRIADFTALGHMSLLSVVVDENPVASFLKAGSGNDPRMSETEIDDLTPLAELRTLQFLSARSNNIKNVEALRGLSNLRSLDLSRNAIRDISALAGLSRLTRLMLPGNLVSDLNPVSGLTQLAELGLDERSRTLCPSRTAPVGGALPGEKPHPGCHARCRFGWLAAAAS